MRARTILAVGSVNPILTIFTRVKTMADDAAAVLIRPVGSNTMTHATVRADVPGLNVRATSRIILLAAAELSQED